MTAQTAIAGSSSGLLLSGFAYLTGTGFPDIESGSGHHLKSDRLFLIFSVPR